MTTKSKATVSATYTTDGPVRGDCGHQHRSMTTAMACLQRDRAGCKSQGGYSDRQIVASAEAYPGEAWDLEEAEIDAYESVMGMDMGF